MALFGAPSASPADAMNAVKAAITMQKRLATRTTNCMRRVRQDLGRIGLHTGEATIGSHRFGKTFGIYAIGDTVISHPAWNQMRRAGKF